MKKALITGVTGQDGSYLAELLLAKGYEVHGLKRRASLFNTQRVDHLYEDYQKPNKNFHLHFGDLSDGSSLIRLVQLVQPDEIYNLGAMSHVKVSFEVPEYTADVNALGTLRLLEAIRILGLQNKARFYQASTSEMFGGQQLQAQNETTPFHPRSPYATAKLFAYWTTVNYRESYDMFACNGILFNHESPRRGETFVTRKITRAIAKIALGLEDQLYLGNLNARRDWGHAKDYVLAMWMMMQEKTPHDYVIATGQSWTIREFLKQAFEIVGVELEFEGQGVQEVAKVARASHNDYQFNVGDVVVKVDPFYFRPLEVDQLQGDAQIAQQQLKWLPKYDFKKIVAEMVKSDLQLFKQEKLLRQCGYEGLVSDTVDS